MNKNRKSELHNKPQIQLILSQLAALRRELRETLRAYSARLEVSLAETANEITAIRDSKKISREGVERIRGLGLLLRKHKLKPQKGRRKDLRKMEKLIQAVHAACHRKIPGK